ncbi:Spo11/DNA topoisomerase VI subunit A [Cladochytrium replicatum]|nr:Spo11/DNA topoisomerase VI subunit A [Cladochytrium replicatum]
MESRLVNEEFNGSESEGLIWEDSRQISFGSVPEQHDLWIHESPTFTTQCDFIDDFPILDFSDTDELIGDEEEDIAGDDDDQIIIEDELSVFDECQRPAELKIRKSRKRQRTIVRARGGRIAFNGVLIPVGCENIIPLLLAQDFVVWNAEPCPRTAMIERIRPVLDHIENAIFGLRQAGDDAVGRARIALRLVARSKTAWNYDAESRTWRIDSRRFSFRHIKFEDTHDENSQQIVSFPEENEIIQNRRKSGNGFSVYTRILKICYNLLVDEKVATKRDVYYQDVALFKSQRVVDQAVDDIACSFKVPRYCLNVDAAGKGLVIGSLKLVLKSATIIDCSACPQGTLIPSVELIDRIVTDADFVLVVEKEATFSALLSHGLISGYPLGRCILITVRLFP